MSVVRFLHVDALRLGSPVAGLSDSPDWLRKVATSAVRTAVTNAMEAAVASRCQFVLISGRLTELDQDLDLAVSWLSASATRLREHGIRLVIAGHAESDAAALRRLDAIFLPAGQRLDLWYGTANRLEMTSSSRGLAARSGALGVEVGTSTSPRPMADMAYVAVPSVRASDSSHSFDGVAAAHDRMLRLSAGAPQALSPAERGVFGCQMVEVDLSHQTMTARFCPTDVIRFAQELVSCSPGMNSAQLCDVLRERSRAIGTNGRCTTVVEWIVDGQMLFTSSREDSLCELELLRDLRNGLHAGHSGAWPCRIRFSENSTVDLGTRMSPVTVEFTSVVCERLQRTQRNRLGNHVVNGQGILGIPLGAGSETAVGLDVLRRVA